MKPPKNLAEISYRPLARIQPDCGQWNVNIDLKTSYGPKPKSNPPKPLCPLNYHQGTMIVRGEQGQTFHDIAWKYYGSSSYSANIQKLNRHVSKIQPGTLIFLPIEPVKLGKVRLSARGERYVAGRGDTLYGIAQWCLGDGKRWREILRLNRGVLPDERSLEPGMVLQLPSIHNVY